MKPNPDKRKHSGLYVVNELYPHITGGMEIFNYYFLKHQLATKPEQTFYFSRTPINQEDKNFIRLRMTKPVRVFYPLQFFFAIKKIRKLIDFVSISFSEQSWILIFSQAFALRLFRIPYVVTIHWGKQPNWKFEYPYKYYFNNAHSVIGVSVPICEGYKKVLGGKDVLFIPPLIPFESSSKTKDEMKTKLGYSNDEKIILFVGTLKPMKNPDVILQAMLLIGDAFLSENKIRLLFAGGGEMLEDLKSKVEKEQLTDYVRFDGSVSRTDMPGYYRAADFYIISSDYEGTSISLLEAMYNKLPIIAADSPGINEMLTNLQTALLYKTKDVNKLAESLIQISLNGDLAKRIAENAYLFYEKNYSFDSMMKKYEDIFSSVS